MNYNKLWKILKEMGIPDHLTCLLRSLYVGQEAKEPYREQLTGSGLRKEYNKAVYCHPVYVIIHRAHQMKCWARWITSWNQDYQEKYPQPQIPGYHHSNGRKWRGTKEPLDEGEGGQWKSQLKTQFKKTKIMASSPITSWQIVGEKMEAETDFLFLGSKTADSGCSHEIKDNCFLAGELW